MAEPFKNVFNVELIEQLGHHLHRVNPAFPRDLFILNAQQGLMEMALKERSEHIAVVLAQTLPLSVDDALATVLKALHPIRDAEIGALSMDHLGVRGWAIMPLASFVAQCAATHFDQVMSVLAELTCRFTAEFALRRLINADPQRAMRHVVKWSQDTNVHVRRLASEGTRPRLPWGEQLPSLIADPAPMLPILRRLRDDPSAYVRRSVANHLNDIGKDHPELLVDTVAQWLRDAPTARQKMLRHASRSLIKQGHPRLLTAFGYSAVALVQPKLTLVPTTIAMGQELTLQFDAALAQSAGQAVIVDYAIEFVRANGRVGRKVFKWKTFIVAAADKIGLRKKHSFKAITTRKYYPGKHRIEVQINGDVVAWAEFMLTC